MSNDNILFITAGYDRTIKFWNATHASIYRTIMHEDSVKNFLRFSIEKLEFRSVFSQLIV